MRHIEGFPIGDIEDILELSDPPYYTAYPNPYIKEFIKMYGTPYDEETDDYNVEPFVGDVSEGKNDAVYNAHAYSTKVPYKAIKRFIEHYTNPGDIVFDGFCGTGMTGVAAMSSNRNAILNDISTLGSFISSNYNRKINIDDFIEKMNLIIDLLKKEVGWMYETEHKNGKNGFINSTIWSDVFYCPHCKREFIFWDLAVTEGTIHKDLNCECGTKFIKKDCEKVFIDYYDTSLDKNIRIAKQVPVEINYSYNRKRFNKKPDSRDLELLKKIDEISIPYWHPTSVLPEGVKTKEPFNYGIYNVHMLFSKRNLYSLSFLFKLLIKYSIPKKFVFTSIFPSISKLYRYRTGGGGSPSNNLYIPSLVREQNLLNPLNKKLKQIMKSETEIEKFNSLRNLISNQSSTDLSNFCRNSIDYIFVDPPFGENIMYSELNFTAESWLNVFTNNKNEAIINNSQSKGTEEYKILMIESFKEFFRILKPNRWITVEFHNSQAAIWKVIQESIVKAGFVIAQVAILNKKQGTFNQVSLAGAVKNDLVINAYKPYKSFSDLFLKKTGVNMEKDFIEMHLQKLPIEPNVERTQQMIYSKLLAQYIQNGFEVRQDALDFYELLSDNFEERDGYWFNQDQITKYEKRLKLSDNLGIKDLNQTILGISDEKTAIIWLAQFLRSPKTYTEIYNQFLLKLMTSEDEMPGLKTILKENFSKERGKYRLPSDLERGEKEQIRQKRLMEKFNQILDEAQTNRKIKEVRKEALLHGLMKLYQDKDEVRIRLLGAKLDQKIIDSDDDISAIINWAKYR